MKLLAAGLLIALVGCFKAEPPRRIDIRVGVEVIHLDVADTPERAAKGLMGVLEIPRNGGMLFPFPRPKLAAFWMKNCPIPMDMVFLARSGDVQAVITALAEPRPRLDFDYPVYTAMGALSRQACVELAQRGAGMCPLSAAVIELRAGRASELGIRPGRRIEVPICLGRLKTAS